MTRRIMLGLLVGTPLSGLIPRSLELPTLDCRPGAKIIHGFRVQSRSEGWARASLAIERDGRWVRVSESFIEPGCVSFSHRFPQPIYADRWVVSVSAASDHPVKILGGFVEIESNDYRSEQSLPIAPNMSYVRRALPLGDNPSVAMLPRGRA